MVAGGTIIGVSLGSATLIALAYLIARLWAAVLTYADSRYDLSDQLAHGDIPHVPTIDQPEGD